MNMRALTGMLALMLIAITAPAPAQEAAVSSSMFTPCRELLTKAEIATLRKERISEESLGLAKCLRLTRREFVLFTGDGIMEVPFRYCAARRVPACEPEPFRPYAFDVVQEFTGANGKRFMLWRTYRYQRGVYSHGYGIASLVPRSVETRGFGVYALAGGAIFRGEDPSTSDPCQDMGDEATEITGYELAGEGTPALELRFTERVVNCKTMEEQLRLKRYRPSNGVFELVP